MSWRLSGSPFARLLGVRPAAVGATLSCITALGCRGPVIRAFAARDASLAPSASAPRAWKVGTARVDVTPPPGPTTFGHGPDGMATQGYWTRLECRIFAFEVRRTNPDGAERYAIVPCDLPAISYALFRDVADRIENARTLGGAHLLLTATHTHAGPAHYFEAPAFSGVLSSRNPGFDDDMLRMIASRISQGIEQAFQRLVPAEARWVSGDTMWRISRNRSLEAFVLNGAALAGPDGNLCPAVDPVVAPGPPPEEREKFADSPCRRIGKACEAIDPMVQSLELRELGGRPLGSITFLAMHPTVLPAHNRLWGGDVFGLASRELEHRMRREWAEAARASSRSPDSDPLAAIVNTNEGDISPIWSVGDKREALAVGGDLSNAIWTIHADRAPFRRDLALDAAMMEVKMQQAARELQVNPKQPAILGQSSSHGGSDHRSTVDDLFTRGPDWTESSDGQSPKAALLGELQTGLLGWRRLELEGPKGFPGQLPFAAWHIGDRWIAAVPAEATYTAGLRIRHALAKATGDVDGNHQIVAGLANAYIQYLTTCEEYGIQRYEGGSNLYGPLMLSYVTVAESWLACRLAGKSDCGGAPVGMQRQLTPFAIAPDADRTHERFPQPDPLPAGGPRALAVCRLASAMPATGKSTPRFCFRWIDMSPGDLPFAARDRTPGPWLRVRRALEDQTSRWDPADPRSFVDDWGDGFEVRVHEECSSHAWGYSALFEPQDEVWTGLAATSGGRPLELAVLGGQGERLEMPFSESTRACTREEELFCTAEFDPAVSQPIACRP